MPDVLDRSVAIGRVRWRDGASGTTIAVSAGRFFRGDLGGGVELTRRFGVTELGFFLRRTDLTTVGGTRVAIPLAPRRELAPRRVRMRAPDYWEHAQQITLFEAIPFFTPRVGVPLTTGHEVARVYGGRDWLTPAIVQHRLPRLREAALRWGGRAVAPNAHRTQ